MICVLLAYSRIVNVWDLRGQYAGVRFERIRLYSLPLDSRRGKSN